MHIGTVHTQTNKVISHSLWSACLPNLTYDYFLWGSLKDNTYRNGPLTDKLTAIIRQTVYVIFRLQFQLLII